MPAASLAAAGRRHSLYKTARVLVDAWDGLIASDGNLKDVLVDAIEVLRSALAPKISGSTGTNTPRAPKGYVAGPGVAMVRWAKGASAPQIAEATG